MECIITEFSESADLSMRLTTLKIASREVCIANAVCLLLFICTNSKHNTLCLYRDKTTTKLQQNYNKTTTKLQQNYNKTTTKLQQNYNKTTTKLQQNYNKTTTKLQQNYNKTTTKLQQNYNKTTTKLQQNYNKTITKRYALQERSLYWIRLKVEISTALLVFSNSISES